MWKVCWYGSFCEFCRTFETKEEAERFYKSLGKNAKKELYKN